MSSADMVDLVPRSLAHPTRELVAACLIAVVAGRYGTPDAPIRGASHRDAFWRGFHGHRKPSEYRGTVTYIYVKAGEIAKKQDLFNQETEQ